MTKSRADLLIFLCAVIGSTAYPIGLIIAPEIGPLSALSLRFILGVCLVGIFYRARLRNISLPIALRGLMLGILLGLGIAGMWIGLFFSSASQTSFLSCTDVMFIPIINYLLFRERTDRTSIIAIIIATIGVFLLTARSGVLLQLGDLWVLGGAFIYAFFVIFNARFARRDDSILIGFLQLVGAALLLSSLALLFEDSTLGFSVKTYWLILYLGVIGTGFRFVLQAYAQRYTTAAHVGLIFLVEPLLATTYSHILLSEQLSVRQWLGGGLILTALVLSQARSLRSRSAKKVC